MNYETLHGKRSNWLDFEINPNRILGTGIFNNDSLTLWDGNKFACFSINSHDNKMKRTPCTLSRPGKMKYTVQKKRKYLALKKVLRSQRAFYVCQTLSPSEYNSIKRSRWFCSILSRFCITFSYRHNLNEALLLKILS